uniref:RRM domain-containing protein n=1 Tax=Alexandrium monilatum TaxID=311494 RepID=A0A7S4S5H4_9DINO
MAATADRPDHVFATDLPADITEELLQAVFGQYGTVLWCKLFKGMGKTAALIQLSTADEAAFLVENMNGAILSDQLPGPVTLCYSERGGKKKSGFGKGSGGGGGFMARPSPYGPGAPRSAGAPRSTGGGPGTIEGVKKELETEGLIPGGKWSNDTGALHVGGLPADTTDVDLYEIFSPFGALATRGVKAMTKPDGSCTGVAFVNYLDPDAAQAAIVVLNGREIKDGSTVHVKQKRQ